MCFNKRNCIPTSSSELKPFMITSGKRNSVNFFITSDFVHLQFLWGSLYLSGSRKSKINISLREALHLASLSFLFGLCTPVVVGNLSVVFGGFVSVKREKRKCLCDLDSFKWGMAISPL